MADSSSPGEVLAFGRFRLDRRQRLLWAGDQLQPLEPKVFETLLVLVEARGRLVPKDELLTRVWPDTFVEEGSLPRNVSTLRKVLGEGGDTAPFIETIAKRGYRFVAEVRTLDTSEVSVEVPLDQAPAAPLPVPARTGARLRLRAWAAVL